MLSLSCLSYVALKLLSQWRYESKRWSQKTRRVCFQSFSVFCMIWKLFWGKKVHFLPLWQEIPFGKQWCEIESQNSNSKENG